MTIKKYMCQKHGIELTKEAAGKALKIMRNCSPCIQNSLKNKRMCETHYIYYRDWEEKKVNYIVSLCEDCQRANE